MFISIDGIDGCGKSTQIALLADWLRQRGADVLVCRDPGSTPLGEAIRELLLSRHDLAIHRRSEMLLYMAARAQLAEEVIRPALQAGKTVLCDRYLLANVAYQGHAGGLGASCVWDVGRIATGGIEPELVVLLDLDPDAAAARIARPLDRMERQGVAFQAEVRKGYLAEAARDPQRIVVLSAARPREEVQEAIRRAVLNQRGAHGVAGS